MAKRAAPESEGGGAPFEARRVGSSVLLPELPPDSIKKPTTARALIATMVKQVPSEEPLPRAMFVMSSAIRVERQATAEYQTSQGGE